MDGAKKILSQLKALRAAGVEEIPVDSARWAGFVAAHPLPKSTKSPAKAAPKPALRVAEPAKAFNVEPEPMTKTSKSSRVALTEIAAVPLPAGDKKTKWAWLRNKVLTDPEILKHVHPGKQAVFGVGNLDSPIFFCGEAPGADEETQGIPFVGRAGQLLTKIIEAMGVSRDEVYIGNIMNWRPETGEEFGNRPPTYEEMVKCLPYLKAQVQVIQPKVIVALGATAVTGLLGPDPDRRMGSSRGNFFEFAGTPVMVTYHPSYLLRNNTNAAKRVVWEDLMKVMERVGMPISEKQRKFFT